MYYLGRIEAEHNNRKEGKSMGKTFEHTATYSPEDNKLRMYPDYRLALEDYKIFKNAGFRWAPKQELFVAPMWTPARADLLIKVCGEIGDEDTSLVDRAEIRAERFENYSDKRANEANAVHDHFKSIADNIPFGQPILVGHHSEKRARKDAEKIEKGMRKSIKLWDTSKYWEYRAAGALRHAKYKENPGVRARRIKKIEAEKRKYTKTVKESKSFLNMWLQPVILTKARALFIANYSHSYFKFSLERYPREEPISQYEGDMSLWGALDHGIITAKQARNLHVPLLERTINHYSRWIDHCKNRLVYEKAMLESQGASDLLKPKKRPKQLPLCNYEAPQGIEIENMYRRGEFSTYQQKEMTKAEYKAIWGDSKGTAKVENSHRVRVAYTGGKRFCIFLTDSKTHKKPEKIEVQPDPMRVPKFMERPTYKAPERTKFDDMKDSLKEGVKVVSAPQLFPTPQELAQRMVNYAGIKTGHNLLEPEAGTGVLLDEVRKAGAATVQTAVEVNSSLCDQLKIKGYDDIRNKDFLSCNGELGFFNRIIMNPPFEKGQDIKHIKHAITFLKPGGRLVALCANGPNQNKELKPIAEESGGYWEDLPEGSFKAAGTMVNTAMLIIEG